MVLRKMHAAQKKNRFGVGSTVVSSLVPRPHLPHPGDHTHRSSL